MSWFQNPWEGDNKLSASQAIQELSPDISNAPYKTDEVDDASIPFVIRYAPSVILPTATEQQVLRQIGAIIINSPATAKSINIKGSMPIRKADETPEQKQGLVNALDFTESRASAVASYMLLPSPGVTTSIAPMIGSAAALSQKLANAPNTVSYNDVIEIDNSHTINDRVVEVTVILIGETRGDRRRIRSLIRRAGF